MKNFLIFGVIPFVAIVGFLITISEIKESEDTAHDTRLAECFQKVEPMWCVKNVK
jgi:hypothetical protein